jgi:methionine--tRNA ligase beta chain
MLSFDDFAKIELKVVKVITAERVEGSNKLLKLRVDLGELGVTRQILAGIGKVYTPEELVGKQIVIVANLEPRMLMGLESNGMVLAANGEIGPVILIPEKIVESGASIQ